ncbi:helix-turn-helix domain-containing protein [Lamprobacter modestohalophilus]|uniref:helix-turn-helix domain-containing protein n=1 Tax=Lamprobacter modestohalophilus TaxID=1064514 RepID=UPI002ADEFB57|nr:helix-turn-helix domain-containing protein [Lamprobacter modestohalophilus]MEA1051585.1 helix-turn-helix domain-containing protein [Lamprobacter modestohalophilus]
MPKTEQELLARDAGRDIGAELLQAARDLRAGHWARKTSFEILADGAVRRRIERADGTVEKDEVLTGPRWELLAVRTQSGLPPGEFARALGVSRRTVDNWEQGRAEPTGAARQLLRLAARFPETVERLAQLEH